VLLCDECGRRVPVYRDADDVAASVMDHEEYIERPEEDRLNAEQVAGPNSCGMRSEEPAPTKRRRPGPRRTQILSHGPGTGVLGMRTPSKDWRVRYKALFHKDLQLQTLG
jgi:hypothetical protein